MVPVILAEILLNLINIASTGIIIGVSVAVLLVVCFFSGMISFILYKKKKNGSKYPQEIEEAKGSDISMEAVGRRSDWKRIKVNLNRPT